MSGNRMQKAASQNKSPKINLNHLLGKSTTLAEKFHEKTKIKRYREESDPKDWPEEWRKVYFKGYSRLTEIALPKPQLPHVSLEQALWKRKSERNFSEKPLDKKTLSTLLYYSAGLREQTVAMTANRFYPSSGARYPLEVYVLSLNTELKKGLYHYYLKNNSLEKLLDISTFRSKDYLLQDWVGKAACIIIITAVFKRNTVKYGDRGYRLILQESGHLAQNFYLNAAALDLACCATAGFIDDKVNALLDIDGLNESVLYILSVGYN